MQDKKTLTIEKRYLEGLAKWLQENLYQGPDSRVRTRFVLSLIDEIVKIDEKRIETLKKYANKNEDGSPSVLLSAEGRKVFDVSPESKKLVDKEMDEFLGDVVEIVINPEDFRIISLVLDTDQFFGADRYLPEEQQVKNVRLANEYLQWCVSFEKLRD